MVDVADMRYARELGYSIKLLAVAELVPDGLELHVSPTLVRRRSTLAQVDGAYNAIRIVGDAVGRVFLHGLGAGQMPTASACVADLIDTLLGRAAITFRTLKLWSDERRAAAAVRDPANVPGRFYLRFNVDDRPGVMADIAGILGRHKISIASVIQHETAEEAGGCRAAGDHDAHHHGRRRSGCLEGNHEFAGGATGQRAAEGEGVEWDQIAQADAGPPMERRMQSWWACTRYTRLSHRTVKP